MIILLEHVYESYQPCLCLHASTCLVQVRDKGCQPCCMLGSTRKPLSWMETETPAAQGIELLQPPRPFFKGSSNDP